MKCASATAAVVDGDNECGLWNGVVEVIYTKLFWGLGILGSLIG